MISRKENRPRERPHTERTYGKTRKTILRRATGVQVLIEFNTVLSIDPLFCDRNRTVESFSRMRKDEALSD